MKTYSLYQKTTSSLYLLLWYAWSCDERLKEFDMKISNNTMNSIHEGDLSVFRFDLVKVILSLIFSLALWYGLIQGAIFAYAQIENLNDPVDADPSEGSLAQLYLKQNETLPRKARPDVMTLAQSYAVRLASIDSVISATMTSTVAPSKASSAGLDEHSANQFPTPEVGASSSSSSTEQTDAALREAMLDLLRELGLVSSSTGTAMSEAELDRIVGGQAAPAGASSVSSGESEDNSDPQLDALNRVLVEAGGLLLPPWTVEIQPVLTYSYKGANGLLILDQNGQRQVLAHSADLTRLEGALVARLGLPWQSQAEIRVPYSRVSEESSYGNQSSSSSEHGLGDIEIGLSHQLLREKGWLPDLIGELRYRAPTGDDSFDGDGKLPLGTGFHGVGGRLTAVKALDPVVFVGSAGYTVNLKDTKQGFDIDPGDTVDLSIAAILAAGPRVSLRTGFGLSFTGEAEVDNDDLSGSDTTEGVLNVGGAVVLPNNTLLDLGVGVGVTDDAPDVTVRLALAHRF
jgi:hypothetical protein